MARIVIMGSSEGLGLMAAQLRVAQGHEVVLHARSAARAVDARVALPAADAVVDGDVATLAGMRQHDNLRARTLYLRMGFAMSIRRRFPPADDLTGAERRAGAAVRRLAPDPARPNPPPARSDRHRYYRSNP